MDAAGGAAAAAIPAPAAPPPQPQPATPDELELARYGAPRDTPPALASKFLELARSKAPEIVFDPTWGLKFAHPEGSSQFSRFGWLVKPRQGLGGPKGAQGAAGGDRGKGEAGVHGDDDRGGVEELPRRRGGG